MRLLIIFGLKIPSPQPRLEVENDSDEPRHVIVFLDLNP